MLEHEDKERAPLEEPEVEIDFEPEEELGDIGAAKAKLKKLRDELEKAKKERQEYLDGWQRCKADSINAKRESALTFERMLSTAKDAVIEDIIPIIDSFDMAAGTPAWESVEENWRSGMDQIRNQLLDVLARYGVERFGKVGDTYSPHMHEAAEEIGDVAGEPGSIVRILRYGYRNKDRILRPAHVVIKSG